MAGTLVVNANATWMPAGWLFDFVISKVAERLRDGWPQLADTWERAATEHSVGYLNLGSLSRDELQAIGAALSEVRIRTMEEGPTALADPAFYDGLVRKQGELVEMIQSDPRLL